MFFKIDNLKVIKYFVQMADLVEFNALLKELFRCLEFCQHDSEYRVSYLDEEDDRIQEVKRKLNDILEANPFLIYNTFIYSPDYYRLNEGQYQGRSEKWYAGSTFIAINKDVFYDFCERWDIRPQQYIINDEEMEASSNFEKDMHELAKIHYLLPKDVTIPKRNGMWYCNYGTSYKLLSNFEFIDVVKIQKHLV
jgi:hypothetical protein